MLQRRRAARQLRLGLLLWVSVSILLSGCGADPTPPPTTIASNPRSATLSDLAGDVAGRATRADPLAPVGLGFQLNTGGQVQTGDDSRARLDFTDQSILRLAANSAYTLDEVENGADGSVVARVQLTFGKLWVSVTGGAVEVETPVGVASVRGSFAVFQYAPGDPNDPNDDLLLIDCLEGTCTARNPNVDEQLGNLERLVLNSQSSLRQTLTRDDVLLFLLENPESDRLVPTLTAAPPATPTETPVLPTATRTATPLPATATSTLAPLATLTATALIPVSGVITGATATATITAPATTTSLPRPPAFRILGAHVVQSRETLFCIGRGYGVLPAAIALANNRSLTATLNPGTRLSIPAIQWDAIPSGPVCAPQFNSPFPGLPISAATSTATSTATLNPVVSDTPTIPPSAPTDTPVLPTNTLIPTLTSTPIPPTLTFTPTPPTVTLTPSPTPDLQGPSLSNFNGVLGPFDFQIGCNVNFAVDITDGSGVAGASVDWAVFDASGQAYGITGTVALAPRRGNTWGGSSPVNSVFVPPFGTVQWSVTASDVLNNMTLAPGVTISETTGQNYCG